MFTDIGLSRSTHGQRRDKKEISPGLLEKKQPVLHVTVAEKLILFGILGFLALSALELTPVNGKSLTTKNSKYISNYNVWCMA